MKLPPNTDQLADEFTELSDERKQQVLDHLKATGEGRRNATLSTILKNGGMEAQFLQHVFGKDLPDIGESPQNKKINPVNRS